MNRLAALLGCVLFSIAAIAATAAIEETAGAPETTAQSTAQSADDEWYLLEFASGRPLCETRKPSNRCWQTQPEIARFDIRNGEVLEMPEGTAVPESWARLQRLWVYAPGVESLLRLTLTSTPRGLRIELSERAESYLQMLPEDEWVPVDGGANRRFWARASRP